MINTQSATREIKTLPDFEKMYTIYESMVKIGIQGQQVSNKGQAQVVQQMKRLASEFIPCGEELASVISEEITTLDDWIAFSRETPEIYLEKEMQWPVDPDLIY